MQGCTHTLPITHKERRGKDSTMCMQLVVVVVVTGGLWWWWPVVVHKSTG